MTEDLDPRTMGADGGVADGGDAGTAEPDGGGGAGEGDVPVASSEEARDILRSSHRVAIVGASNDPARPSHGVMQYLLDVGYDCVPINPREETILGRTAYPDLAAAVAAGGPFDVVDVFRRPNAAPDVAREAIDTGARTLWMQLGVISPEAARIASEAGLRVVMDHCMKIEHRAMRAAGD